jgi:hypothetical protein
MQPAVLTSIITSLCFLIGILLQSVLILGHRVRPVRVERNLLVFTFIASLIFGLAAFLPTFSLSIAAIGFFLPYVGMYAMGFRDYLLPRINERGLLIWDTLLICLCLSRFGASPVVLILLAVFIAMSCGAVALKGLATERTKMAFYTLFLLTIAAVAAVQFLWSDYRIFFDQETLSLHKAAAAFFLGMNGLYIGSHLLALDYLPRHSKRRSKKREIYLAFIDAHISDQKLDMRHILIAMGGIIAAFVLNEYGRFLSDLLLGSILITVITLFLPIASYYHGYSQGYKGKRDEE